jgi:hypothetical protein
MLDYLVQGHVIEEVWIEGAGIEQTDSHLIAEMFRYSPNILIRLDAVCVAAA